MKGKIFISGACLSAVIALASCSEDSHVYSDAEYIMFADTMSVNVVLQGSETFSVPVVSTVTCDYDRTFGVEIVDSGSTAIEGRDYTISSNMLTIKAGENRADVIVPAGEIFLTIASITGASYIYVPVIGLSDGIIDGLYTKHLAELSK